MNIDRRQAHPFIRHRDGLDVYHRARGAGLEDADWARLVAAADDRVRQVDGRGFAVTPLVPIEVGPAAVLGPVLAKVETGSVGASHKARHLFGLLLGLLLDEAAGVDTARRLVIASCGNAALGAAIVARSAGRTLEVFVPESADAAVTDRLDALGAVVSVCPRLPGRTGDPCLAALEEARSAGARPFTVQGTVVPAAIDGARTIGLELAEQLETLGVDAGRLFIQIGGGALATAVMDGLVRARPGRPAPTLHPVQPRAAHPYVAAWHRVVAALAEQRSAPVPTADPERAALVADAAEDGSLSRLVETGSDLMVPWPDTPTSVASGIVDDLTYDWRTVLDHQVATGGWPLAVDEETFTRAVELVGDQVTPAPDATGAAGLAGLLTMAETGAEAPVASGEVNVVLLTGAKRKA